MSDEVTKLILENVKELNVKADKAAIDIVEIKGDINYHIKRTDLVESNLEEIRTYVDSVKKDSHIRLTKLEKLSEKFHYLGWLIGGIMALIESLDKLHLLK